MNVYWWWMIFVNDGIGVIFYLFFVRRRDVYMYNLLVPRCSVVAL